MLGEIFSTGAIRIQFIHLRFGISLFLYTSVIDSCSFSATAVVKRVVQHLATPRGGFFPFYPFLLFIIQLSFLFLIPSSILANKIIHISSSKTATNLVFPSFGAMSPKLTVVLTHIL